MSLCLSCFFQLSLSFASSFPLLKCALQRPLFGPFFRPLGCRRRCQRFGTLFRRQSDQEGWIEEGGRRIDCHCTATTWCEVGNRLHRVGALQLLLHGAAWREGVSRRFHKALVGFESRKQWRPRLVRCV